MSCVWNNSASDTADKLKQARERATRRELYTVLHALWCFRSSFVRCLSTSPLIVAVAIDGYRATRKEGRLAHDSASGSLLPR